jgi:glycerol uptake facilitator-like aquaporin
MYKYLVEFTATVFFVYIILATGNPLAIGASLALIILLISSVSQGFLNPAVTIALASSGNIQTSEIIPYVLSQTLGALVALEIYKRYKL